MYVLSSIMALSGLCFSLPCLCTWPAVTFFALSCFTSGLPRSHSLRRVTRKAPRPQAWLPVELSISRGARGFHRSQLFFPPERRASNRSRAPHASLWWALVLTFLQFPAVWVSLLLMHFIPCPLLISPDSWSMHYRWLNTLLLCF